MNVSLLPVGCKKSGSLELSWNQAVKINTTGNVSVEIIYCNHIKDLPFPQDKKNSKLYKTVASHPVVVYKNPIRNDNNIPVQDVIIQMPINNTIEIKVHYWTTFYVFDRYYSSAASELNGINERQKLTFGYREKNTFTHTFNYSPPPTMIVNVGGTDYDVIDDNNNLIGQNL